MPLDDKAEEAAMLSPCSGQETFKSHQHCSFVWWTKTTFKNSCAIVK